MISVQNYYTVCAGFEVAISLNPEVFPAHSSAKKSRYVSQFNPKEGKALRTAEAGFVRRKPMTFCSFSQVYLAPETTTRNFAVARTESGDKTMLVGVCM